MAPFPKESPEEKYKKINCGLKYMYNYVHCTYSVMYIYKFLNTYLRCSKNIPNSAWLALPLLPSTSTIKTVTVLTHFRDVKCSRLTTASQAAAMFNDATVYHVSEMISTVM
jgi:hypothetical protein